MGNIHSQHVEHDRGEEGRRRSQKVAERATQDTLRVSTGAFVVEAFPEYVVRISWAVVVAVRERGRDESAP